MRIPRTGQPDWLMVIMTTMVGAWILWACAACSTPRESEFVLRRLATGMVDATDLPLGWGDRRSTVPEVSNATARSITYYAIGPGTPYVNVGQRILIYPSEDASKAAFQDTVAQTIPAAYEDEWVTPPELTFAANADEIRVACLSGFVNGIPHRTCSMIARYGDMLTHLHGNVFEDRWLTMEQFRRLVQQVDAKMYRASQLSPDKP